MPRERAPSSLKERYLLLSADNTHYLPKGKYHCSVDHLFGHFGFSNFVTLNLLTDLLVWWNPKLYLNVAVDIVNYVSFN